MTESQHSFFDPSRPLAHIGKKIGIAVAILAIVVIYYLGRYSKWQEVVHTITTISPLIFGGMIVAQLAYIGVQSIMFQRIYYAMGFKRTLSYHYALFLAMNLVNTVAPVVGISGSLYMMHFEKSRGMHRSESLIINFIYYVTDYLVLLLIIASGIIYLLIKGETTGTILKAGLIFTVFVLTFFIGGLFLLSHSTALYKTIRYVTRLAKKFGLKAIGSSSDERIAVFVEQSKEAWVKSRQNWWYIAQASIAAIFLHVFSLILLYLAFRAVTTTINLPTVAAGYTIGTLLNVVSVTPGGIGFAEGGMTAVFAALEVPVEQALVITLLYRTVFVWVTLLLGVFSIQLLPRLAGKSLEKSSTIDT